MVRIGAKEKRSVLDHANGFIDDFASISLTEGDFDHSTLASEGKLQSLEFR